MSGKISPRMVKAGLLIALLAVSALPFLPGRRAPFFYDDYNTIVMNPAIKTGNYSDYFTKLESFASDRSRMFRPLVVGSLAWNWSTFGDQTAGWHATNLGAHLICVVLVFLLIETLSGSMALAFLAALFFGIHPSRVEPAIYISARSEVFASLFYLLAFYLFLKAMKSGKEARSILLGVFSLAGFWLGLLSKDIAITLPAVLTVERLVFRKLDKKSAIWLAGFWASAGVYFLIRRSLALATFFPPARPRPVGENLLVQSKALIYYLRFLIIPIHQSVEQHFSPVSAISAVVCIVLLGTLLLTGILLLRRQPLVSFFIFFFFIVLSPSSSLVPLVVQGNLVRVYMASLLVFIVLGQLILLSAKWAGKIPAVMVGAAIFACLFLLSLQWSEKWDTPRQLWWATVSAFPEHGRARDNLGLALEKEGNLEQAELEYAAAVNATPENANALDNYARLLFARGELERAELLFKKSLQSEPLNCATHINYSQLLITENRLPEAMQLLEEAGDCPNYANELQAQKKRVKDLMNGR